MESESIEASNGLVRLSVYPRVTATFSDGAKHSCFHPRPQDYVKYHINLDNREASLFPESFGGITFPSLASGVPAEDLDSSAQGKYLFPV